MFQWLFDGVPDFPALSIFLFIIQVQADLNPTILCSGRPLVLVHPISVIHSVFKLRTASPGYTENEQFNTDVQAIYQIGFKY